MHAAYVPSYVHFTFAFISTLALMCAQVPPLLESLQSVQRHVAALPPLSTLASQLVDLNHSVLNTSGLPT